jgi:hypothetical protein
MLKIWLNWLQPSLGVLGVALVLSNAVSAHAASKATGKETNKLSNGNSQPQVAKPNGFSLPQMTGAFSPSSGVSLPPDVAIRRLALDTIANSETKSPNLNTQASRRDLGNIVSFTSSPSTKSTNAHFVKHSLPQPLSSTGVYSPSFTAAPLVPGLFIGRSNTARFSPSIQPVLAPVAKAVAVPIATPKVVASAVVATPFPVMLPERMTQPNSVQTVATDKTNSVVARSARSTTTVASGLQNILGGESSSQTGSGLDTAVASGLQNVLGNEPKAIQSESMVALSKLVAPESKIIPASTRGTLQLATSQSYVSAPEFDLPGVVPSEPVIKSAQAIAKAVPVKNVRKDLSTAVVQRKNDYVTLMSDKNLESQSRSSWQTMSRSNSLGGLILGSRSTNEPEIAALPMKALKPNDYSGLGIFNPFDQY